MKLISLLLLALLLAPGALALDAREAILDSVGLEALDAPGLGSDGMSAREIARRALTGEFTLDAELPARAARTVAAGVRDGLTETLRLLAPPVLAILMLRLLLGRRHSALVLLCRLVCAVALLSRLAGMLAEVKSAMAQVGRIADAVAPVLSAALALTGSGAASAMLTPASTLCAGALEDVLAQWGLTLCALAAIVASAGNLSDHFRLDRLFALLRSVVTRGVALLIAAFVGMLALEGRLAAAQDAGSARAIGSALAGLIPIIGAQVSASGDALVDSALAVRSAVGATGMLFVFGACAARLLKLTALLLSVRLAAAVIEPVADPGIARMTWCCGEVARMLTAIYAGGVMLVTLLAGTCLAPASGL